MNRNEEIKRAIIALLKHASQAKLEGVESSPRRVWAWLDDETGECLILDKRNLFYVAPEGIELPFDEMEEEYKLDILFKVIKLFN